MIDNENIVPQLFDKKTIFLFFIHQWVLNSTFWENNRRFLYE